MAFLGIIMRTAAVIEMEEAKVGNKNDLTRRVGGLERWVLFLTICIFRRLLSVLLLYSFLDLGILCCACFRAH